MGAKGVLGLISILITVVVLIQHEFELAKIELERYALDSKLLVA